MSERWHTLSVEEIAEKINTDIDSGLSASEAASRRKVRNDGSAFTFPMLSSTDAAKLVLNDVALYFLFFSVGIICSVFEMWAASIVALAIVGANCLLTVSLKVTSNKYENMVVASSMPRVNLLRDGKVYSEEARNVVFGDILILREGDILPCDVRIVSAKDLTVYEAISEENGKKKYSKTRKFAGTLPENARLPIDKVSNMLFAGGMITSGGALGIAVACGKNTYACKRFDGVEMRTSDKQSRADANISTFFRYVTNIMFVLALPFSLVSILFGNASVSPLDALSQTVALAVSLPMQTIIILYSTVICCAVRYCALTSTIGGAERAILKNYAAVERLDNASKLFMLGRKTLVGNGRCIESVFVNLKRIVSPADTEEPQELKDILECAYLINKAATETEKQSGKFRDNESIILRSMREFSIDVERITQSGSFLSYKKLDLESCSDVAIVADGEDFSKKSFLVCRAFDDRIIECANWYTSDGVDVKLDDITRERIKSEYSSLKQLGYDIISIAKASPSLYDRDSFDFYDDQLVLVGILAVGPSYSRENSESVKELVSQGLSPVLCFEEESEENFYIAKNIFKSVKSEPITVYASELVGTDYTLDDYPDADVYLGFTKKQISELISMQRARGIVCAATAVDFSDLQAAGQAHFVIGYTNETLKENACTEPYPTKLSDIGASCSAVKRYSDMLVSPVKVPGGGLDGVKNALACVRSFFSNLEKAVSYLISSLIMRMLAVYLPLAFGRPSMNAAMILYLGCIVDLAAVLFISLTGFSTDKKKNGAKSFSSILTILRSNLSSIVFSTLSGLIIVGAGLIIPKSNNGMLQDYLFLALLTVQLSTFVYSAIKGSKKIKTKDIVLAIVFAIALLFVTVLLGVIPGVRNVFGIASSPAAWIRAIVVFVICTMLGFVSFKDRFFA